MSLLRSKPVWCPDDGLVFSSINEAARHYQIDNSTISKAVRGVLQHAGGKQFEAISEQEAVELGLDVSSFERPVRIICLNDNREWSSIRDASRHYGIDQTSISKHLHGKYRHVGGYTFEKVEG